MATAGSFPWRTAAGLSTALGPQNALAAFDAFRADTPKLRQFRHRLGLLIARIRSRQRELALRARRAPGPFDMFATPPIDIVREVDDIAGDLGLGGSMIHRVGLALVETIAESTPGDFGDDERRVLEELGMMASTTTDNGEIDVAADYAGDMNFVTRDARASADATADATAPEDTRTIIIEQTRDNVVWRLVDLYVVSVQTGMVERMEGIPVPRRNDKDTAVRWFVPKLAREITDMEGETGFVAFADRELAMDYLEGWCKRQRQRLQGAYKWLGQQARSAPERERRLS